MLQEEVNLGDPASTLASGSKVYLSCEKQVDDEVNAQENVSGTLTLITSWGNLEQRDNKVGSSTSVAMDPRQLERKRAWKRATICPAIRSTLEENVTELGNISPMVRFPLRIFFQELRWSVQRFPWGFLIIWHTLSALLIKSLPKLGKWCTNLLVYNRTSRQSFLIMLPDIMSSRVWHSWKF